MPQASDFRHLEIMDAYSLARRVRPGAVRDAIWRAEELCRKVPPPASGNRFLVAGSGPAGMAAVTALLDRGFRVVHYSRELERGCIQYSIRRTICPTTFDYPKQHWGVREYPPVEGVETELPWKHGIANVVLQRIYKDWTSWLYAKDDVIEYEGVDSGYVYDIKLLSNGRLRVYLDEVEVARAGKNEEDVDGVVLCTGFGKDQVPKEADFASYGFFDNHDDLINSPKSHQLDSVLIIGGGDGALGDFVRLKTGFVDPFKLLEKIEIPDKITEELQEFHKDIWSSFSACVRKEQMHAPLMAVQQRLVNVVDRIWGDGSTAPASAILDCLAEIGSSPAVQVCFPCRHFDMAFFANRLFAQLVARAVSTDLQKYNGGLRPFRIATKAAHITGIAPKHSCKGDAKDCAAFSHYVTFQRKCCDDAGPVPEFVRQSHQHWAETLSKATITQHRRPRHFDRVLDRTGPKLHTESERTKQLYNGFDNVYTIWDAPPFAI